MAVGFDHPKVSGLSSVDTKAEPTRTAPRQVRVLVMDGLQHMEDRIHGCQGTLEVASSTGGGTTVSGTVPLQTGRHRARRKN